MKKYFLAIVLTLIAASSLAWYRTQSISYIPPVAVSSSEQVAAASVPEPSLPTAGTTGSASASEEAVSAFTDASTSRSTADAPSDIHDGYYKIVASRNGTVLETMDALAATGKLSFSGQDFPGIGFFVDTINGKKNGGGYYWILYINGKTSDLGVSVANVRPDDRIEWKYEEGY